MKKCKARLREVVDDCGGHFIHPIICDYMFVMGQLGEETRRADENEAYLAKATGKSEELETQRDVLYNGCVLAVYRFDRGEALDFQEIEGIKEAIKYAMSSSNAPE